MGQSYNPNWRQERTDRLAGAPGKPGIWKLSFISQELDLTVMTTPKVASNTCRRILSPHPQFEHGSILDVVANPTSRIITFIRPEHERLVSAWSNVLSCRDDLDSFEECVEWVREDPKRNVHCFPQKDWLSFEGRYIPTETYPLEQLDEIFLSIRSDPPLRLLHENKDSDKRQPYKDYYTPELWDKVTEIYAEYA